MKKIILGSLILGSVLFASEQVVEFKSNLFDLNKIKSKEMRGFLARIEQFSWMAKIIKDYYEAKTCNKEFYNEITMEDIEVFFNSPASAFLMGAYIFNEKKSDENQYLQVINDYKFMNCGEGEIYNVQNIQNTHSD